VDHLYEHFPYPVVIKDSVYVTPTMAGGSIQMKPESLKKHAFPVGEVWQ